MCPVFGAVPQLRMTATNLNFSRSEKTFYAPGADARTTIWDGFFTAQIGASAALAGLIFVGVSINMSRILALPRLPERALQAIIVLLTVLVLSSLLLVPGESTALMGAEILGVGGVAWAINTWLEVGNLEKIAKQYRRVWLQNTFLGQAALLPYIVGGVATLAFGADGVYFVVPGMMFSYVKAIVDSWVLLIEINR
jgi:hypothetical protein